MKALATTIALLAACTDEETLEDLARLCDEDNGECVTGVDVAAASTDQASLALSSGRPYKPNALAMYTTRGTLTDSPIAFNGSNQLSTQMDLEASRGTLSLTSEHYKQSSFGLLKFKSGVADKALFSLGTGRIEGTGPDAPANPIMALGYNTTPRGSKWQDGEQSLTWNIEADWFDGTNRTMELYAQYGSADGMRSIRPFFFMFNRKTDRLANAVIRGNPLNVQDDLGTPAMEIGPVVTNMYSTYTHLKDPNANIIGARNVYLSAGNTGGSGSLYLGAGTANPVHVCVNGCETTVGGPLVVSGALQVGGDGGPKWLNGVGSPEGVVRCSVGCMYTRTDGGPGTTLYVKESGTGTTGWAAK